MGVSVPLLLQGIFVPFGLLVCTIVVVGQFLAPGERPWTWILAAENRAEKLALVLTLVVVEGAFLLLPLDVANEATEVGCGRWPTSCGELRLGIAWQVVITLLALTMAMTVPYSLSYYDAYRCGGLCMCGGKTRRDNPTRSWVLGSLSLLLCTGALVAGYVTFGDEMSVEVSAASVAVGDVAVWIDADATVASASPCGAAACLFSTQEVDVPVPFVIFVAAILVTVGWIPLATCGGLGLVTVPVDLFVSFCSRAAPDDTRVANRQARAREEEVRALAAQLVRVGALMAQARRRGRHGCCGQAVETNKLRVMVRGLFAMYRHAEATDPRQYKKSYNPFLTWSQLLVCLIGAGVSVLFLLHICLFVLPSPPVTPMLNDFLIVFAGFLPVVSTLAVACFALYLVTCTLKGVLKLGVRTFIVRIHPLEPGETSFHSAFFNLAIIAAVTLPVVQLLVRSFESYAARADASLVFVVYLQNLAVVGPIFKHDLFIILLVAMAMLTALGAGIAMVAQRFRLCKVAVDDRIFVSHMVRRVAGRRDRREERELERLNRRRGGGAVGLELASPTA